MGAAREVKGIMEDLGLGRVMLKNTHDMRNSHKA